MDDWFELNMWLIREYVVIFLVCSIIAIGHLCFFEYVMDQTNPQIKESYPVA